MQGAAPVLIVGGGQSAKSGRCLIQLRRIRYFELAHDPAFRKRKKVGIPTRLEKTLWRF
jgi:hypothetical protein